MSGWSTTVYNLPTYPIVMGRYQERDGVLGVLETVLHEDGATSETWKPLPPTEQLGPGWSGNYSLNGSAD